MVPTGGFQARLVRVSPLDYDGDRAAMQLELYGLLNGSSKMVAILEFRGSYALVINVSKGVSLYVITARYIFVTLIVRISSVLRPLSCN